jgi:hypothetical protein
MNYLTLTLTPLFLSFVLGACSQQNAVAPSQNAALNSVTKSSASTQKGSMQNAVDKWIEKEWTPSVEKNTTIQKINRDKERSFKLQEYVDKMEVYNKESNQTSKSSHTQKVNSLPVIGGDK